MLVSCLTLAFVLGCAHPQQSDAVSLPSPGADGEYSPDWPDLGRGDARYIDIELGDSFETCRHLSPNHRSGGCEHAGGSAHGVGAMSKTKRKFGERKSKRLSVSAPAFA
ncbi:MAG TPA: hypothetical protein VJV79_27520 [Polyangiaceae bacterium]|nr:hypothetical protein [Polyangiaceae bacterium]